MTSVEKRHSSRRSGGHRKHSDASSGGSFPDETDREVSSLTDRAFRSLCIGDEAVYNDSDLCPSSPATQREKRPLAFSHAGQEDWEAGEDGERDELKRAAHDALGLRAQQYGQEWIQGGQRGPGNQGDLQFGPRGEARTDGGVSATFQRSLVDMSQRERSVREEHLSFHSNGGVEPGAQQSRSRSRVSSLIKAFNSDGYREGGGLDGHVRDWNSETSWDKSALMSIQRELSEFSTAYHQSFDSGGFLSADPFSSGDGGLYASEAAAAAMGHMDPASSFMRAQHSQQSLSTQLNSNSNFFMHSELSPFKLWRDHNRFPFRHGEVAGYVPHAEFPRWYETPMYRELSLGPPSQGPFMYDERAFIRPHRKVLQSAAPPPPPRSTSTSTVMQKASALEKRCESELAGHPWKRARSFGDAKRLPPQRPSTVSPTLEMSRHVRDTLTSITDLQQKISTMTTEHRSAMEMMAIRDGALQSSDGLTQFSNKVTTMTMEQSVVSSNTGTALFNVGQPLMPAIHNTQQEMETSEVQQYPGSSPIVEHAPVRAESRGATPDVRMSSYKSRATSLLFNLKDNRKRVKSTYSPTKFKGSETMDKNKWSSYQDGNEPPRDTVIDIPEFSDTLVPQEEPGLVDATLHPHLHHSHAQPFSAYTPQHTAAHIGQNAEYTPGNYLTPQMQAEMAYNTGFSGFAQGNYTSKDQLANGQNIQRELSPFTQFRLGEIGMTETLTGDVYRQASVNKTGVSNTLAAAISPLQKPNLSPRPPYSTTDTPRVNVDSTNRNREYLITQDTTAQNPHELTGTGYTKANRYEQVTENKYGYSDVSSQDSWRQQAYVNNTSSRETETLSPNDRLQPVRAPWKGEIAAMIERDKLAQLSSQRAAAMRHDIHSAREKWNTNIDISKQSSADDSSSLPHPYHAVADHNPSNPLQHYTAPNTDAVPKGRQPPGTALDAYAFQQHYEGHRMRESYLAQNNHPYGGTETEYNKKLFHYHEDKHGMFKEQESVQRKDAPSLGENQLLRHQQNELEQRCDRSMQRNMLSSTADQQYQENSHKVTNQIKDRHGEAKADRARAKQAKAQHGQAELTKAQQAEKAEAAKIKAEWAEAAKIKAERADAEIIKTEQIRAERIKTEQAEAERIKKEQAEAERIKTEQLRAERIKTEQAEAERIKTEQLRAERIKTEQAEAERIKTEQLRAERIKTEQAEAERIKAEKAEAERIKTEQLRAERIKTEQAEAEGIKTEQLRAERIKTEQAEGERIKTKKAETERIKAEKAEAERIKTEELRAERIKKEQAEAERIKAEKAEAERIKTEQLRAERIKTEQAEAEIIKAEQAKAERIKTEQAEAERIRAEQAEAERIKAEQPKAEAQLKAEKAQIQQAKLERMLAEQAKAERMKAEQAKAEEQLKAEKAQIQQAKLERMLAEQDKAERMKAEQAKAEEQLKAEKAKIQQAKLERMLAEQDKAERMKAEQAKAEEQLKAEKAQIQQSKLERMLAEQDKAEWMKAEQAKAERMKAEQAKAELARIENIKAQSAKSKAKQAATERVRVEPARVEQVKTELARAKVELAKIKENMREGQTTQTYQQSEDSTVSRHGRGIADRRPGDNSAISTHNGSHLISRIATAKTEEQETDSNIKFDEVKENQYIYSETLKEFTLSSANDLPTNSRKPKSTEHSVTSSKGLSQKERAQTKQEILTSKIKAHAEKEISAIREKGFAHNPIKHLTMGQSNNIRQRPPTQEVSKRHDTTVSNNTTQKQHMEAEWTESNAKSADEDTKQRLKKEPGAMSLRGQEGKHGDNSGKSKEGIKSKAATIIDLVNEKKEVDLPQKVSVDKAEAVVVKVNSKAGNENEASSEDSPPSLRLGPSGSTAEDVDLQIMGISVIVRERKPSESHARVDNIQEEAPGKERENAMSDPHGYRDGSGSEGSTDARDEPAKSKVTAKTQPLLLKQDTITRKAKDYTSKNLNESAPLLAERRQDAAENSQAGEDVHIGGIAIRIVQREIETRQQENHPAIKSPQNSLTNENKLVPSPDGKTNMSKDKDGPKDSLEARYMSPSVKQGGHPLRVSDQRNGGTATGENKRLENGQLEKAKRDGATADETKGQTDGNYFQLQGANEASHEQERQSLNQSPSTGHTEGPAVGGEMEKTDPRSSQGTKRIGNADMNEAVNSGMKEEQVSKQSDGPTERQSHVGAKRGQDIQGRKHDSANQSYLLAKEKHQAKMKDNTAQQNVNHKAEEKPKPKEKVTTIPEISALADYARLKVIASEDNEDTVEEPPPSKKEDFFPRIGTRHSRRPVFTSETEDPPVKEKTLAKEPEVDAKVTKEPKTLVLPSMEQEQKRTGLFRLGDKERQETTLPDIKASAGVADTERMHAQHLKQQHKDETAHPQHMYDMEERRAVQLEEERRAKQRVEERAAKIEEERRERQLKSRMAAQREEERRAEEERMAKQIEEEKRAKRKEEERAAKIAEERRLKQIEEEKRAKQLEEERAATIAEERRLNRIEEERAAKIAEERRLKRIEEERAAKIAEERRLKRIEEERAAKIAEEKRLKRIEEERAAKIAEERRLNRIEEEKRAKQLEEERAAKIAEEKRLKRIEEEKRAKQLEEERAAKIAEEKRLKRIEEEKRVKQIEEERAAKIAEEKRLKRIEEEKRAKQLEEEKAAKIAEEKRLKRIEEEKRVKQLEEERAAKIAEEKKLKRIEEEKRAKQLEEERAAKIAEEKRLKRIEEEKRVKQLEEERAAKIAEEKRLKRIEEEKRVKQLEEEREAKIAEEKRLKRIEEEKRAKQLEEERAAKIAEEKRLKRIEEEERVKQLEEERAAKIAEEKRLKRIEEERAAKVAEEKRLKRIEEEKRAKQLEEERAAKIAEEKRLKRIEEEKRVKQLEEERAAKIAEEKRLKRIEEEKRVKQLEEERAAKIAEEKRLKRIEEEKRVKQLEEERAAKIAEEKRLKRIEEERAAKIAEEKRLKRIEEEKRVKQLEEERAAKIAEEKRLKRIAEEKRVKQLEEERAAKIAEEKRLKRIAEEKRVKQLEEERAAKIAEEKRLKRIEEEERTKQLEERAAEIAEEKRLKRIEEERAAKIAEEKRLKRIEEEKRAKQLEEERAAKIAEEKRLKRIEEEKKVKQLEERAAKIAEEKRLKRIEEEERVKQLEEERAAKIAEEKRLKRIEEEERVKQLEEEQTAAQIEEERRAKQIEDQRDAKIVEERRLKHIEAERKERLREEKIAALRKEEERKEKLREERRAAQKEEEERIKQREEEQEAKQLRQIEEEQRARRKEERAAQEKLAAQREEEEIARQREEEELAAQREEEKAARREEKRRAAQKMDPLQYYAISSTEGEKRPRERPLRSPLPSPRRVDPPGAEPAEDWGSHNRPQAPASPALSLPRSNTSSPALGAKPTMFRVKDNTFRASPFGKSVKPRFHKTLGEDFRAGSPLEGSRGSERADEEQDRMRRSAGTPTEHRPYSRRSVVLDEEDSRSLVSALSEDVESFATGATDLADIKGLYDPDRPESACSFSSDAGRPLGKPPSVPPKSDKALRRAKRLTTRRIKKELTKGPADSPVPEEEPGPSSLADPYASDKSSFASPHFSSPISLAHAPSSPSNVPSSSATEMPPSHRSSHATPHATAPVSIPVSAPHRTGLISLPSSPRTVSSVPSSPTHHHANNQAPVTQYRVEPGYGQSYPMTQRKVLQDPGSGQYFVVDMPVQVKTKTFFDPETGKYVQLNVRQSAQSGTLAKSQPPYAQPQLRAQPQPKPQPSSTAQPYVLYQGYQGYPQGYQPVAVSSLPPVRASSVPSTVPHETQPGRPRQVYGYQEEEGEERDENPRTYSPEQTPYMDTAHDTHKTCDAQNTAYNTRASYETCPGQLGQDSVNESDGPVRPDSQGRDIIPMGELEDFMDVYDW